MDRIEPEELRALALRIAESGELGRSRTYSAILNYLVECSIAGETPKEMAIAVDVLGREADFDVGKDSIVRVHIYHLRSKLESYFEKYGDEEPYRLEIPKGQYNIVARVNRREAPAPAVPDENRRRAPFLWLGALAAAAAVLLAVNLVVMLRGEEAPPPGPHSEVLSQAPWRAIMDDRAPILLVVGDYYIFGELDRNGNVERMVREFDINSKEDLDTLLMMEPALSDDYYHLGLSYLPTGTAPALTNLMPLLYGETDRLSIKTRSELNASDLTSNHVIYVGYLSGLGLLQDLMFTSSGLAVGTTYDELVNTSTGDEYISDSGIRNTGSEYQDYAMVSTFPSPGGYQFIMITGLRDAGLINAAQDVSDAEQLARLNEAVSQTEGEEGAAWEALYEVYGLDHTNFDSSLVYSNRLQPRRIWTGRN